MNYEEAKQLQVTLNEESKAAWVALGKFPRAMFGGTTAEFRDDPTYLAVQLAYRQARLEERAFNEWFAKTLKKQIASDTSN